MSLAGVVPVGGHDQDRVNHRRPFPHVAVPEVDETESDRVLRDVYEDVNRRRYGLVQIDRVTRERASGHGAKGDESPARHDPKGTPGGNGFSRPGDPHDRGQILRPSTLPA